MLCIKLSKLPAILYLLSFYHEWIWTIFFYINWYAHVIFLSDRLPEILKKILETSPPDNFLTLGLRELSCYLQSSLPFPVCSREGGLSATCGHMKIHSRIYNTRWQSLGSEKPRNTGLLPLTWDSPNLLEHGAFFLNKSSCSHRTFSETHLGNHSTDSVP